MGDRKELSEFDLRVLLAVEATHGDKSKITEEVRGHSSAKVSGSDVTSALRTRLTQRKYVERVGDESYRLTVNGRRTAEEAAEGLRRLATYAASVLG